MNRRISWLICLPLGLLVLASCQEKEEQAAEIVRPVLSQVVMPQRVSGVTFAGTVQPKVQTALGFRVIGLMVARDVDTGDTVTRGQTLAAIDPTTLELAVSSARADLASAEATLANTVSVEERTRALFKSGTQTQAAVESAEQVTAAAQSALVQARTSLSKSEEQLSYARITAEFDGVVTTTGAEVGQVVSAGETVVTVARPDARDAVVDVPDSSALLPVGTPFTVSLQINPSITVPGKVREIAPAADAATRTRRVKIALDNPPASFRLGTTITATLDAAVTEEISVPQNAILSRDGKSFVWVVDETKETVSALEVSTGSPSGSSVIVTSGIEPGMRVVTAGVNRLKEGQKVIFADGDRS